MQLHLSAFPTHILPKRMLCHSVYLLSVSAEINYTKETQPHLASVSSSDQGPVLTRSSLLLFLELASLWFGFDLGFPQIKRRAHYISVTLRRLHAETVPGSMFPK